MSVQYPETLVLGITTHGSIPSEENSAAIMQVPEGMRITKISAIPIGMCNVTTESNIDRLAPFITKVFQSNLTEKEKIQTVVDAMGEMQSITSSIVKKQKDVTNVQKQEFLRYSHRPSSIVTYTEGQDILNKDYLRELGEGMESPYDFKMTMLNVPGNPDLLRIIATGRTIAPTRQMQHRETAIINLRMIVTYLKNQGVKNIILFDLSCAVMEEGTPRDIRAERRGLEKRGLNGGKKKTKRRQSKKTKTRKANKKVLSWSY
jgi:hypothetical protein